jgi:5-oxoprolinase (ATP-hydrolysing) subunit A
MRKSVELAIKHGVAIGSHPSLPDLMGFGRRVMDVSPQELKDYLCYQTGALREFCRAAGVELQHTKPHGILYSMIEKDEPLATAVAESARESGRDLILMALGSGNYDRLARKMGVRVASEGFADRAYNVDLTLVSRKLPGSLITDPQKAAAQAVKMAMESKVRTIDGVEIDISVQTICCHGDTPGAQNIVRAVREALDRAGCQVKPLRDWLPKA